MEKHIFIETKNGNETGVILGEVSEGNIIKYKVRTDNGEELLVDKSKIKDYKIETNYVTDLNGRKENFSETPFERKAITYYNSVTGKWQTQNYIELDNIIVSPMVRINEKTGEFEFALLHKTNASMMKNNQYNGQVWEVPTFTIGENDNISEQEIEEIFDEQCLRTYGEEYFGSRKLQDGQTPVSQSFTNQLASFKVVLVYYNEKSNLDWYPISSLSNCIEKNKREPFASLQTAYALELMYDMYKEQINNLQKTEFNIHSFERKENIKTKEVSPNKYRFGIEDIIYDKDGRKEYDTYATSKNSIQCILTRRNKNGQTQIGLSKQQRSPFIAKDNFDEYLYEGAGGMLETGEEFKSAAVREAREETGYDVREENLKHLAGPLTISLATQETTDFYLCEIDNRQQNLGLNLDEQENIGEMEWLDLEKINIEDLHSPLVTKYVIFMTAQYYKAIELENKNKELAEDGLQK